MKVVLLVGLLFYFGCVVVEGSMWLRYPVSRGGYLYGGATNGPCGGKTYGTGQKTTLEADDDIFIVLRANKIGRETPSFAVFFSRNNGDLNYDTSPLTPLNVTYEVNESLDDYKLILIPVKVPDVPCKQCSIQVIGQGLAGSKTKHYNCADIEILPAGSRATPHIESVVPSDGPTSGGTNITVTGTRFGAADAVISCRFEMVEVPALRLSENEVSCVSPPRNVPKEAVIDVIVDGVISSSGKLFNYTGEYLEPIIKSITPSKGYPSTSVIVEGENFFSPLMLCKFGDLVISGARQGSNTCRCRIPGSSELTSSRTITIDVSVDGSPFSESEISFEFLDGPRPEEILGISLFFACLLAILLGFAVGLKTGFIQPESFTSP